jgi:hypothetical protein
LRHFETFQILKYRLLGTSVYIYFFGIGASLYIRRERSDFGDTFQYYLHVFADIYRLYIYVSAVSVFSSALILWFGKGWNIKWDDGISKKETDISTYIGLKRIRCLSSRCNTTFTLGCVQIKCQFAEIDGQSTTSWFIRNPTYWEVAFGLGQQRRILRKSLARASTYI